MQTATRSTWAGDEGFRDPSRHPPLVEDRDADVAVIGAGITGLTTALLLARSGLRVAVIERDRVGSGTTGRSTGHLTAALDLSYAQLASRFGTAGAQIVVESVARSIGEIERIAGEIGPAAHFRRLPGYRFTEDAGAARGLAREAALAGALGLDAERVDSAPLPFPCASAVRFGDQAAIDPLGYVRGLAELVTAAGGAVFEHAPVVEASDDGVRVAGGARVRAAHVIEATQTPIGLAATIQTRVAATTSYVIEAKIEVPLADALFWDCAEPYHYLRTVDGDGRRILVGGEDHPTGREKDPEARLVALEAWMRARFPVASVEARWSHELFEPADGLPYIGLLPGARSHWIAAGFSGTGLTFGTAAALLLRDLVTVGASPWAEPYSSRRLKPLASGLPIARENLEIGWHFLADRLRAGDAPELGLDQGRIERSGRRQVAVYRDLRGDLHFLSPRCPHLGCIVGWNAVEKTWDCPCHGGRFAPTGKVLYGPPTEGLAHVSPGGVRARDERKEEG